MTTMAALRNADKVEQQTVSFFEGVASLARSELTPILQQIDDGEIFPDKAMRRFGEIGAWSAHADLRDTIGGISAIAEVCGATAFMAWCQDTLVWYILNSDNAALKAKFLDRAESGQLLGGTGLSNPMKSFFGIEKLKLKAAAWTAATSCAARCRGCPISAPTICSAPSSNSRMAPTR